ncbi:hypothetical protein PG984_006221 [Apiospora sp. TS-2023a]
MVSSGSSRKGALREEATLDNNSSSSKKLPWNDPNNKYKVDWDRFEASHPKDRPMDHNQKKRPQPEGTSD